MKRVEVVEGVANAEDERVFVHLELKVCEQNHLDSGKEYTCSGP